MTPGIQMDAERAAQIPKAERCKCCRGTGNMMLGMYSRCLACNGDGKSRGTEAERLGELRWKLLWPGFNVAQTLHWESRQGARGEMLGYFHRGECGGSIEFTGDRLWCVKCRAEQLPVEKSETP